MKKITLSFICLFACYNSFSQMLLHGDHMPLPSYRYSNAQPNAPAVENPQKAFNVYFHDQNRTNQGRNFYKP